MRLVKLKMMLASLVAVFAFSGCTQYEQAVIADALVGSGDPYYYDGYNYGYNRNALYRYGITDGCNSRKRGYTIKNRYRWNNYASYRNGWYAGYRQCRVHHYSRNYYNRGYNDGCYSKRHRGIRKNRSLFRNNRSYRRGWNKGYRNCRRRY
jgi:hypothetical protein